ncbi:MAG TPA: helix-turn-helix transcriptional regulator [Thermoanaerobaculia bacterium]|nr:helix-turn-helix transcriptional regulator [Thermoanaerobaculia bacterium]
MNSVRRERLARGIGQGRLAESAGISRQTLHAIEGGAGTSVSTAIALVGALNGRKDLPRLTVESVFATQHSAHERRR